MYPHSADFMCMLMSAVVVSSGATLAGEGVNCCAHVSGNREKLAKSVMSKLKSFVPVFMAS